jgi:hypothetical protein
VELQPGKGPPHQPWVRCHPSWRWRPPAGCSPPSVIRVTGGGSGARGAGRTKGVTNGCARGVLGVWPNNPRPGPCSTRPARCLWRMPGAGAFPTPCPAPQPPPPYIHTHAPRPLHPTPPRPPPPHLTHPPHPAPLTPPHTQTTKAHYIIPATWAANCRACAAKARASLPYSGGRWLLLAWLAAGLLRALWMLPATLRGIFLATGVGSCA